ncbi:Scr1 family TA system antitoxin-like transcriptional regulator [Streptomyces chattanoogensis]|uniref:Scr1 family TA system antitoxin-like transcriptional regulator n=1 Tax=Streptomyces chattanoogensis TaxID=66876 RepID=UPI001FE0977E|nr:Scr1 family TA system antitoxin-like transcriptional regulator [Streptomyces chattanoogensis]
MLQTADYGRHVFIRCAEFANSKPDADEAAWARLKRQEWLYQPGNKLHVLMWQAALHVRLCPPPVLAAQLDRLVEVIDMDTVSLGIVPLGASLRIAPANGFCILDNRVAVTEDPLTEQRLDDTHSIATYMKAWSTLRESAAFGADAQNLTLSEGLGAAAVGGPARCSGEHRAGPFPSPHDASGIREERA